MATRGTVARGQGGLDLPEPYEEQKPFMGNTKRYYGFVSGSGAGKTFSGVYRLALNVELWNPGEMGAIVVPNKNAFMDNIKPVMEDVGLWDKWDYRSPYTDEPGLYPPTGERILILGAENIRRIEKDLKGKSLAHVWMDEEAEIDPRAREILIQRLRTGAYPNLYVTTTPKGKNHTYDFFYSDCQEPNGQGTLHLQDERLAIVGVPTDANPNLRQKDVASMRDNLPEQVVAQEIEGDFVEIGSGVFNPDMLTFIHHSEVHAGPLKTVIGVDPAVEADAQAAEDSDSDYWAVCVVQIHPRKNTVYVTDTARRRGMTLKQGVEWIGKIARSSENDPTVIVESNQSQRWLKQSLGEHGINALPAYSTTNKENRLVDLSIPLENDTIQFIDWNADNPEEAGENHPYGELVSELFAFPEGSHDDLIDSLFMCVDNSPVKMGGSILSFDPMGDDE